MARIDRGWWIVIFIAVAIALWGMANFMFVRDGAREWNYGVLPKTPSSGIYSSEPTPKQAPAPRQIQPLPESKPGNAEQKQ
jgi:hypothetical protein